MRECPPNPDPQCPKPSSVSRKQRASLGSPPPILDDRGTDKVLMLASTPVWGRFACRGFCEAHQKRGPWHSAASNRTARNPPAHPFSALQQVHSSTEHPDYAQSTLLRELGGGEGPDKCPK